MQLRPNSARRLDQPEPFAGAGEPLAKTIHPYKWRQIGGEPDTKPGQRSGAASVVFEDSLFIFGGYGGNGRLDDLWEFRFVDRCWRQLTTRGSAPAGRENNGAVVYNGFMYIFGGYSGFFWLNDFHRLNLRNP
jgi:N-acetylneuraminic acid mutarotase